jgi:hypothetical protein
MLHSTKSALLAAILDYMKANGHNMESIKKNNPFPCSTRWVSCLAHSVKHKTAINFNRTVVLAMVDFLKLPHKQNDEGFLVLGVCEN